MFSRIVRRTHMYLALFLAPWMLMYGVSTLVMNHRERINAGYPPGPVPFVVERTLPFEAVFPDGASREQQARQILQALDLDGAHSVNRRPDGTLVINRNDLTSPRRITYTPGQVTIERLEARPNAFLERFHRRRGYATGYALDDVWAGSVDLVIGAMVFWVLSGLWMWWEMKVTRGLGVLAMLAGLALFAVYVLAI